ncbi:long-chain fatty acid--CoA ligase [Actinomadura craniellae]|uniref:Long-chain fatty acid--CoA ligase n=1 Tax=Actinomadura craniellae TaxID=2231787 RepID=A0A365HDA3_9ACTN|nr:fatty acid--CoA ligase family protein [Actinomadura craniellae]RAY16896.1 long-chain fatty acid--CoA ligase [Actinomadura craniellae]
MSAETAGALARRIARTLELDRAARAIEYEDAWWTWGQVADVANAVAAAVPGPGAPLGVVLRNSPWHVGVLLGVLLADACAVTINPSLGPERLRTEIGELALAGLAGTEADLDAIGADFGVRLTPAAIPAAPPAVPPGAVPRPGVAVRMLTSGTTGPPQRVDLGADTLLRTFEGAKHYESRRSREPALRGGVAIVSAPLIHVGGLFRVLQCVLDGRSFVLLPRFEVAAWAAAVRRYRPKTASLVPAALRMVLDSDLTRDDLSSLLSVVSGTAPLDVADQDAFTERFGVPVLRSYGATEFGGGVAGWNLADHREFAAAKRGSVGRAHAGCGLRVIDPDGAELPAGEVGVLEVRPAQHGAGADWMRTADLARIDSDGFLYIVGRADQTIVRGGFKIHPEHVKSVLERHPAVSAAAVLGVPDARLGAVPVAVVEPRPGHALDHETLLAHAGGELARYELPARVRFVASLPRTPSGKVDLAAARALAEPGEGTG